MTCRFHLAIPVKDIDEAKLFYCDFLGCEEGNSEEGWVDINFWGNELTLHKAQEDELKMTHRHHVDMYGHFDSLCKNLGFDAVGRA